MAIESTRVEAGIIYTRTIGSPTFREMSASREEGMRMLADAGDHDWVLIMDMTHAKLPRPDMNVDSLRKFNKQNLDLNLVGYVTLGATPAVKLLIGAYRSLFKVDIHFAETYDLAVEQARKMLQANKNKQPA